MILDVVDKPLELYMDPHVGFITAVTANAMSLHFMLVSWLGSSRFNSRCSCHILLKRAGQHHFGLVAAIFAFADLFDLFLHVQSPTEEYPAKRSTRAVEAIEMLFSLCGRQAESACV
jgi:hypothetical protein